MRVNAALLFLVLPVVLLAQEPVRWRMSRSLISFVSEAPLERISATNTRAAGVIEIATRSFAVQVPVVEFQGFNAPLQREHFNENYMVSTTWPNITFAGRIIESIDLAVPGRYIARAKGDLVVHGVTRERIVPCEIVVTNEGIRVTSNFDVALDEHGIRIPRVVQQKVAPVVAVKVDVLFRSPTTPR